MVYLYEAYFMKLAFVSARYPADARRHLRNVWLRLSTLAPASCLPWRIRTYGAELRIRDHIVVVTGPNRQGDQRTFTRVAKPC